MTDILERLRAWRRRMPSAWYGNADLDAAIEEIKRLRGAAQAVPDPDAKLKLFLAILASANGRCSGGDYPWNWINYFCDDVEPVDTFNQANDRKLIHVGHDSDSDNSEVYMTDAGRAFIAGPSVSSTEGK